MTWVFDHGGHARGTRWQGAPFRLATVAAQRRGARFRARRITDRGCEGHVADRTADRSRRPGWLPLVGAALVVPTVLAGLTQLWPRPQIEDQLTRAGSEALATAGLPGAGLVMAGRDADHQRDRAGRQQQAIDMVQGVPGVRIATVPESGTTTIGGEAPAPAPAPAAEPLSLARRGEDVVLTGVVGTEDERTRLIAAATERAGGRTVVDELTVTEGVPLPGGVNPTTVQAASAALAGVAGGDPGSASPTDGVSLTGSVPDDATRNTAELAVAAALPGSPWTTS